MNMFRLLLHSNASVVTSNLEVNELDELGSGFKFLLGSPQLVPEVSPRWHMATGMFYQVCGLNSFAECVLNNDLLPLFQ